MMATLPYERLRFRLRRWPKFRRLFLSDREIFVSMVNLYPGWGECGLEWPTMRVDRRGGSRETVTPVWNLARLRSVFFDLEDITSLASYDTATH